MSIRIQRGAIFQAPDLQQKKEQQIDKSFESILKDKIGEKGSIKLSSHAEKRLVERQIYLQKSDMNKLGSAIDKLEEKGAKESLMIYKDMAFIASIKNRTIITAMGRDDLDIVTNIDSTMMVK